MAKKGGAPTKSEILRHISKDTELSRKQVGAVFDSLTADQKSLRSHGIVTLPGLLKLKVVKKPATKAREGINPFTGKDDVQGQARQQESARAAAEEPQGLCELKITGDFRSGIVRSGCQHPPRPCARRNYAGALATPSASQARSTSLSSCSRPWK